MPGGGGPKGQFQIPSGAHRPAWGESLAGGTSAGTVLARNPASASAVWQSVLTSLGVGVSERDAEEPAISESQDSAPESMQGNATESDEAKPFTSGSVSSPREVQMMPAPGHVKSRLGLAGKGLAGQVERQQTRTGPGIVAEITSPQKSAPAEASRGTANSKNPGVSDSEVPTRKRASSPATDEVAVSLPQIGSLQSALVASQPVQQNSAAAAPRMETMWQEKSAFATAQPESASESQLAVLPGQVDLPAARTPSDGEAQNGNNRAREVSAGADSSQPQGPMDSTIGRAVWKEEAPACGETGGHQVVTPEPHQYPDPSQIGAVVESSTKPVSGISTPASLTPPEIPLEAGATTADLVHPHAVQAAQSTWRATETGNRSQEPKSNAIPKSRELTVSPRSPVQSTGTQSTIPTSVPGDSTDGIRASAVVVDAVPPAHPRGTAGATGVSSRVVQAQTGSPTAEAVLPVATIGVASVALAVPSNEALGAIAGGHAGSGTGEAFTALDAEGANRVTWVHAGAQQAEAGFEDPRLGWVSVRADVSGGAIHAALVPASADAAQVMGGHLDGLNAYLSEHHSAVETITLAAPSGRANESGDAGSLGQGMQQRAGQEPGQGSSQENGQGASSGFAANGQSNGDSGTAEPSADFIRTRDTERETAMQPSAWGGRISLMA